jgi:ABC-type sugar transport system permease subunit
MRIYKVMVKYRREYLFFIPAFIVTVVVIIYPFLYNLILSFTRTNINLKQDFIGLGNYKDLVLSSRFFAACWRTIVFSFATALGSVIMGSLTAVVVHYLDCKYKYILLSLYFLPWLLSFVVTGLAWGWLLHPILGPLYKLFNLSAQMSLLGNPYTALITVTLVHIWKHVPFAMITIYAAIQSLPKSPYEAASIDGANSWQQLRYITIPQLRPIITTITLILMMWQLGAFTIFQVMTRGGPLSSTEVLSIYIYKQFETQHFGLAGAAALFLFVFACLLTFVYLKTEFKRIEEA